VILHVNEQQLANVSSSIPGILLQRTFNPFDH